MEKFKNLTVVQIAKQIKEKQIKCEDLVSYYLDRIEQTKHKNAVLEVFSDALQKAKEVDKKVAEGSKLGVLAGVPIIIKDNMLYEGKITSCASKFMENYVGQYTATAVKRLLDEDAVIIGRANMDEFAMGSSCENSAYGPCFNALSDSHVAGGSSGGSACVVALDLCAAALGSDTGGSIRLPASFNGVVGLKGTYGRVSRYGLVAFGSSLDQIGPITKNVEDAALILKVMAGQDKNDQTCSQNSVPDYLKNLNLDIKGKKIGIIKEVDDVAVMSAHYNKYKDFANWLKMQGAEIVDVSVKNYELSLPVYYILAPAEAASNLGRFDGVKYSKRSEQAKTIDEIYTKSRSEGFGKEVKRRIMLGNFVLSSGYYDAYYLRAKRIQQALSSDMEKAFSSCDVIIMPISFDDALELNSKSDPISMYMEDMFTIISNLTGVPAISIPFSKGTKGLPLGLQLLSAKFDEQQLFNVASYIEKNYKEADHE